MRRSSKKPAPKKQGNKTSPHPEVVLLAVTGMSPAILTETVWALAQENPPVNCSAFFSAIAAKGRRHCFLHTKMG